MKKKTGRMRSKKMADEVLESKATEAEETMVDKPMEQEGKEAETKDVKKAEDEKKEEDSILINPRKTGKLKIELRPDGLVHMAGKNIKDNEKLPLFLVTHGINLLLNKDVKPSLILNGIMNYKPFKEKMIVEQYEKDKESKNSNDKQKGSDAHQISGTGMNPLMGMLGSMMASAAVNANDGSEVQIEHEDIQTESNE